MTTPLVTTQDHDAGFKDIEVLFRSGKRDTIRLKAPPYREAQALTLKLQQTKDVICVTDACLGKQVAVLLLDKLTPESAALIETTSFALTFGADFQKKMEAFGDQMLQAMESTDSERKSTSSGPVILPALCGDLVCPSCGCTTGYVVNQESQEKSEPSTSAPLEA